MKWVVLLAIVAVSTLFWLWPVSQPVPVVKNNTIVWLGDSIGAGYGASEGNSPPDQLAQLLGLPISNFSTSGDTTADGVTKIESVIETDPGMVIIQLAGNDALRKLPQGDTEANLRMMIEALMGDGVAVALIGIRSGPFGDAYGDMFTDLAAEYDLIYVPDALKGLFARPEYMADTIHPNDAGSAILAERVYEAIAPVYE
ncbi:GDSL-type esterase/lipase family protein [Candidatus Pacebacteria bacterium]|nr:GDSL-type esterase/lipase family protein [Candidatus Paceibacterota bacterium]